MRYVTLRAKSKMTNAERQAAWRARRRKELEALQKELEALRKRQAGGGDPSLDVLAEAIKALHEILKALEAQEEAQEAITALRNAPLFANDCAQLTALVDWCRKLIIIIELLLEYFSDDETDEVLDLARKTVQEAKEAGWIDAPKDES